MTELSERAQQVQSALEAKGVRLEVRELPGSTRTAVEAAESIGCQVEQIAKSLVFVGKESGKPYLVVAGGSNRVHEKRLGRQIGEKIRKANADEVREATGYAIGGIPPLGHANALRTFIDEDLMKLDQLWAAAGTPHAVFSLSPAQLAEMTGGQVVCVV